MTSLITPLTLIFLILEHTWTLIMVMIYFLVGSCLMVGLCSIFARYAFDNGDDIFLGWFVLDGWTLQYFCTLCQQSSLKFNYFVCLICCEFNAIIVLRLYQHGAG